MTPHTPSPGAAPAVRFADMHLQPGDRLQIHCPSHPDRARHISRVVGFVDGVSLLVTVPAPRGVRAGFLENELVVVQAFSRNSVFVFRSTVLKVSRLPFDYMHLSFPDRIDSSVIRKAARVRVAIDARATPAGGAAQPARLGNLSATGALVVAAQPLGEVGDRLRLEFQVALHDVVSDISAEATILNVSGESGALRYGVEFAGLPPSERMILRSLIYQQMIENPRSLA